MDAIQKFDEYFLLNNIPASEVTTYVKRLLADAFEVLYYPGPDEAPRRDPHEISGMYGTLRKARAAILKAVGDHGKWKTDEAVEGWRPKNVVECWYAGELAFCSGYLVFERFGILAA